MYPSEPPFTILSGMILNICFFAIIVEINIER
jgi:hypothetical protein